MQNIYPLQIIYEKVLDVFFLTFNMYEIIVYISVCVITSMLGIEAASFGEVEVHCFV